jgi:hypothetical protein
MCELYFHCPRHLYDVVPKQKCTTIHVHHPTLLDLSFSWFFPISEVRIVIRAMIVLMMEAVSTSETSVNLYQTTRRNISEDSGCRVFCMLVSVQRCCSLRCLLSSYWQATQERSPRSVLQISRSNRVTRLRAGRPGVEFQQRQELFS